MSIKGYSIERAGNDPVFVFESINPRTNIRILKIVTYTPVTKGGESYFNLGFGDFNEKTGRPDDKIISDNGDMRRVLATVVSTLDIFFTEFPEAIVHITGSDGIRNNYYQKLVRDYSDKILTRYAVQGFKNDRIEDFKPKTDYGFLLVRLKKT